ncbi:FAD-dependent monooxygenase [Herbiconiux sp. CPCC 203407]|uniref:FAD-dependent monooxygenase n=1 Tax=Herbiconiux oxytropis TaxID=2970915 RepID=A0AA41XF74_9MICO|nr:NAD(P)/FAD-dependent oxidoreductase [Herbiconiux oxytropis]MCS5723044.1 FAD-dependent monooxygenase [Herbiconiux oxytropis]MCS5726887.1 FAD-dependent monooxygenase [Herbiconiux oxytropis]
MNSHSSTPPRGSRGTVAIVGAGVGGLSAALSLHEAGFDVTVYEKSMLVEPLGGAITINAVGIVILRSYGIDIEDLKPAHSQRMVRSDGRHRVLWETDESLLDQAGVSGWLAGAMRSDLYQRMLARVPSDMVRGGYALDHLEQSPDAVELHFSDGRVERADLVIGADGINSRVRESVWGPSELKHLGIAVWLGWAEFDGASRDEMVMHHDEHYQLGIQPLRYQEKDCFEWWFVESCAIDQAAPADPYRYVADRVQEFVDPVPALVGATDPDHLFRWVVKYRDNLTAWSKGRATLLGDAAHPTSPYAGYGAGMAIEDGYFLGRFLRGLDLTDPRSLAAGLARYDAQRVEYTNGVVSFAQTLGRVFHNYPKPVRMLRNFLFDHTKIPQKQISKGYTGEAQTLLRDVLSAQGLT